ncbi:MAG: hypothetical protein WCG87_01500 [Bacteroidota bacterium]
MPIKKAKQASGTITAANPMSCRIKGKIVNIISQRDEDTSSPCYKYDCCAKVYVLSSSGCGSGVTAPLRQGDTATIIFAYTLHSTEQHFPNMKNGYSGLKMGDVFIANVEQRLSATIDRQYLIYGYERK